MDFIKKLISGILGFLTGLLPKKKASSGFYLELDEAATGAKPVTAKPVAAKPAAVAPVAVAPTAIKVSTDKAESNGKAPKAEQAIATTQKPTETTFAPQYVAASVAGSNGRRRPGANMSGFLDLARQVKTPG